MHAHSEPLVIECEDLSSEAVTEVRALYQDAMRRGLGAFAVERRRPPNQQEIDAIAGAVVAFINGKLIPAFRQAAAA